MGVLLGLLGSRKFIWTLQGVLLGRGEGGGHGGQARLLFLVLIASPSSLSCSFLGLKKILFPSGGILTPLFFLFQILS